MGLRVAESGFQCTGSSSRTVTTKQCSQRGGAVISTLTLCERLKNILRSLQVDLTINLGLVKDGRARGGGLTR